jgi:hypothetical protein
MVINLFCGVVYRKIHKNCSVRRKNVVKMLFAVAIVGVFVLAGCALCLGALCLCFSIPVFHIFKYLLNSKAKARGTDGELIPFVYYYTGIFQARK